MAELIGNIPSEIRGLHLSDTSDGGKKLGDGIFRLTVDTGYTRPGELVRLVAAGMDGNRSVGYHSYPDMVMVCPINHPNLHVGVPTESLLFVSPVPQKTHTEKVIEFVKAVIGSS